MIHHNPVCTEFWFYFVCSHLMWRLELGNHPKHHTVLYTIADICSLRKKKMEYDWKKFVYYLFPCDVTCYVVDHLCLSTYPCVKGMPWKVKSLTVNTLHVAGYPTYKEKIKRRPGGRAEGKLTVQLFIFTRIHWGLI